VVYELRLEIAAPRDVVWATLCDTASWWLREFRMVEGSTGPILEPHAGGRFYEKGSNGAELLWFHVSWITPPKSLELAGTISPPFGGPASTLVHVRLAEADGGRSTTLVLRDHLFGNVEDKMVASLESGWISLFRDGLKAHVEKRAAPPAQGAPPRKA